MVSIPGGHRFETLRKDHPRASFSSGTSAVDSWLAAHALQSQRKHLSVTRVLVDDQGAIAGYFTLATGQVDFGALPAEVAKGLPARALPVAIVAWLGVDRRHQGRGLGTLALAQALADCHAAGRTFPFVAVILDCIDEAAKAFYRRWDFREMPGQPMRLFLTARLLDALMEGEREG
ncbi:MAG: GNAT family N-acetyltransferase [Deltaproteobacteria bacterium]|nr:GNAT family N-acetyltransferase [Deltaproteobacteria bacterium]